VRSRRSTCMHELDFRWRVFAVRRSITQSFVS
jgi:hypothetical protein